MRTDCSIRPPPLTADDEMKFAYAAGLFRQAFEQAVQQELYGEVLVRIPVNGAKGPGRAIAEIKETFV